MSGVMKLLSSSTNSSSSCAWLASGTCSVPAGPSACGLSAPGPRPGRNAAAREQFLFLRPDRRVLSTTPNQLFACLHTTVIKALAAKLSVNRGKIAPRVAHVERLEVKITD